MSSPHPESIGSLFVIGALGMVLVRQGLARRLDPSQTLWPWFAITLSGLIFTTARVVHFSATLPHTEMVLIRVQFASTLFLPGLALATVEALAGTVASRTTRVLIVVPALLALVTVSTDWLVVGPPVMRFDALGHPYHSAHAPLLDLVLIPLCVWVAFAFLRRLPAIPPSLAWARRSISLAMIVFVGLGIHDALQAAGVFRSVHLFEYAFVVFGVVATRFETVRTALRDAQLTQRLERKQRELEAERFALVKARRRVASTRARLRHLAEATTEGVALLQGPRVLDVNPALIRILDRAERELIGSEASALFAAADPEQLARLERNGEGAEPIELEIATPRGRRTVSVRGSAAPPDAPGTRVLLVRDVSDERALQRRLVHADRLVALGTLAAGTAHEINNPLTYIAANAELLADELEGAGPFLPAGTLASSRELIDDISVGARRIREVVRDLMSLARTRSNGKTAVDVHAAIETALAMAAPQLRHHARVVRELATVPPVLACPDRLGQVLLNLVVNAAQAIPEGHVDANAVTIRARAADDQVVIEICDTGAGMDAATVDRIFDPFFTTKAQGEGTGLGLAICMNIVTELGGRIDVTSAPGAGSTFRVSLPAAEAIGAASTAVGATTTPRLRVLVVDDEALVARAVSRLLAEHHVVIAGSGREALARCRREHFDVVVCDLMMPDVTGMELYREVEAHDAATARRFVFMTGGAFSAGAREFLATVGRPWFAKPVTRDELRRALERVRLGAAA